ncbi:MAG: iron-sulfur cluster repair di-iron protein [Bacteroidota bacterium]
MTDTNTRTVKSFVTEDFRTAAVFEKYSIDFCCHGNVALSQACETRGVAVETVADEIASVVSTEGLAGVPYESWGLDQLIDHIVSRHHAFVRRMIPIITKHTQKVAEVHGARHPEVVGIAGRFQLIAGELTNHMMKEERILFPTIKQAELARQGKSHYVAPAFGTLANPIRMMESEHDAAGDGLYEIRSASGNYVPPEDACTTYRVSYQELEAFERDLHQHVHLENNILFPKALELEARLLQSA